MKVYLAQPFYSVDETQSEACFREEMRLLDACTPDLDIIVFPEYCDVPAFAKTRDTFLRFVERYNQPILAKAAETAKRCNAMVFLNACDTSFPGYRNTTFAFDRQGNVAGRYYKQHLTPGEVNERKLDSGYSFEPSPPYVLEMEGIRFGFLTCYDFYFYEMAGVLAHAGVDVIIGCSHQRTDSYDALEMMSKFFAYNCNAYVLRSSVSMGEDAATGGASMAVSPEAKVIASLQTAPGVVIADVDVHKKLYKPAGFGNPSMAHYLYVEQGRRPYKYRDAGASTAIRKSE